MMQQERIDVLVLVLIIARHVYSRASRKETSYNT